MIRIALLWHMHQPYYKDPFTGTFVLPWVRLHALKDYYGMVFLLKEFPGIKVTFNLVPSLIRQLEDYTRGETDLFQQIAWKDADSLAPGEIAFLLRHFFSTNYEYHIRPYPRYDYLYQKREQSGDPGERGWTGLFSVQELRDLQVWFTLTHFDENYKEGDPRVLGLIEKGEGFSEEDKALVKEVELELLSAVIPLYKEMARSGQIEISTTPFYHPILPLLLDPQEGRNANPDLPEYDLHFSWPEDALGQLSSGLDYMEKIFGIRPRGIWPSEGSLSEGVVTMLEELGVSWTAGDEEVLARSLGKEIARDASFNLLEPGVLYRPYRLPSRGISLFFRDHYLSDLLGFHYQKIPYKKAAADLVGRIKAAGEKLEGDVTVPIILDGENAWEYYPRSGRDFLKELMRLLSQEEMLTTATFSQCLEQNHGSLEKLSPGSWINGNFDIWIGDEEDRKGWELLARTRAVFHENSHKLDEKAVREAREYLYIAMGSDWFWWFGKENPTPDLDIFDRLFRENLRKVYTLLDVEVPYELSKPIASGVAASAPLVTPPTGLLQPVLDG